MPFWHVYCCSEQKKTINKGLRLYIKVNFIDFNRQWYSLQFFTCTGAGDAFAGINHKQCIMGGTLY